MPFSNRIFCRDLESPSLSDVLICLRQHGEQAKISPRSSSGDLLSSFWNRAVLETIDGGPHVELECIRADAAGAIRLGLELEDFRTDVAELPESDGRARVLEQLSATRSLVVVTFLFDGDHASGRADDIAEAILTLFVERARGMAQRDGAGFFDEDDEVILALG